jgi:hypothetical protein
MDCPICEIEEIEPARLALGYRTCLTCGALDAEKETEAKKKRIAIAYDKGSYQYITEETDLTELG